MIIGSVYSPETKYHNTNAANIDQGVENKNIASYYYYSLTNSSDDIHNYYTALSLLRSLKKILT